MGEVKRADHGRKPAEQRLGEGEDRGRERKNGDSGDDSHLVAWWRGLPGPPRKRESCLQSGADPHVLGVRVENRAVPTRLSIDLRLDAGWCWPEYTSPQAGQLEGWAVRWT